MKGIDVSAMSLHKMLAVAKKLDAISEWGSVVALTYAGCTAHLSFLYRYGRYKSHAGSIARSFGYHYGLEKKVRINTVFTIPHKNNSRGRYKRISAIFMIMPMPLRHWVMPAQNPVRTTASLYFLISHAWSPCRIYFTMGDIPAPV